MLEKVISLFTGGAGAAIGNAATFIGVAAALTPMAIFLVSDRGHEVFVTITYRDAAFWGAMFAVNLALAWLTRRGHA